MLKIELLTKKIIKEYPNYENCFTFAFVYLNYKVMKLKFYIILLAFLNVFSGISQVTFNKDSIVATFHNGEEALININLTNYYNSSTLVYWKIFKTNFNSAWQSQVCDANLCYGMNVDKCSSSKPNVMPGGSTALWTLHIFNNGVTDNGVLIMKIYDNNTFTNVIDSLPLNVTISPVSTTSVNLNQELNIFPNPTSDYFQTNFKNSVGRVEIYNLIGRKVKTFEKNQSSYNVKDLRDGMYLVRLYDNKGKLIKVSRLKIVEERP